MAKSAPSLSDKFDLDLTHQLLTGTQAVVRLTLMQRARDVAAGLNTAGLVTGYRGSPIAGLEMAFQRAAKICESNHIVFKSGLNEDLAATALWGAQQAELRGEGTYDGVFGIWYGKGPGVDRTGDVFRHANHAGTSKHGGVLALLGDDHTCESSTSAHQSEFAMVDAMIPVLNPAGVQEILDYGLHGIAMSRFAGVWVSLKCVKDNIESTSVIDGRLDRVTTLVPDDFVLPPDGLNIRLQDQAPAKEARLHDFKRDAVLAYARHNSLDKMIISGGPAPRIGVITTGKSYLDVRQAMEELGIDEVVANTLGLRLYKVAMPYPLETQGLERFADGLELIVVVEEKRSLLEVQVKEELYNTPYRAQVIGKKDEYGQPLFPAKGALEPSDIAIALGERLIRFGAGERIKEKIALLKGLKGNKPELPEAATRLPFFCPGCPHNSSTVVPEGAHAYAGIGCHYMAQWMGRQTEGFTHMGGEGANWIGEAPFSKRGHVFQNLGDGTYIHSGSLAIRAACAAGVSMTYKILYNDAVAMTGGQQLDGHISVPMIVNQVRGEGVKKVVIVTDEPFKYPANSGIPADVEIFDRRDLQKVQKDLSEIPGVTVLVYDQTCAAEKRRRRKRGLFPDPDKRVFINPAVCEGCGDCSKKSNCVAVSPLETPLGTKRMIDQSACNKDFSCVNGFCPSFVTVNGAQIRSAKSVAPKSSADGADAFATAFAGVPDAKLPPLGHQPYAMIVTGVGGTGVVTISAVLAEAAYLENKGFGSIDMTGLAQKGGAVACHMRFAAAPEDITAIRVGTAHADLILGCDLVVTASNKVLETIKPDATAVVYSTHELNIATFTLNPNFKLPGGALTRAIEDRVNRGPLFAVDAQRYAEKLFGDTIASNMFMLGYAYQLGLVPVGAAAIESAIGLNGAAVAMNRNAFRMGRLAAHDAKAVDALMPAERKSVGVAETLDGVIAQRMAWLADYQDTAYAARYETTVRTLAAAERSKAPGRNGLAMAAAKGLYKLMAYKDEYEVGRLYSAPEFKAALDDQFAAYGALEFHLAPPLLARRDATTGEPRKIKLGAWMLPVFGWLAKAKRLRGTAFDVFGLTAERKLERRMIGDYEVLLGELGEKLSPANHAIAVQLAANALDIKGFGHVKLKAYQQAKKREAQLLALLRAPSPVLRAAE